VIPALRKSGVSGPLLVSIGDQEKLNLFLKQNPYVPRELVFVDGYSFDAYKAAGLGKIGDNQEDAKKGASQLKPPKVDWWKYFKSVSKLSPIPKDLPFGQIPEGVTRLGATFVVDGGTVKYAWADRVPGDHPDVQEVLKIAAEESVPRTTSP